MTSRPESSAVLCGLDDGTEHGCKCNRGREFDPPKRERSVFPSTIAVAQQG